MVKIKQKLIACADILKKYKYSVIILLLGVALMCIPFGKVSEEKGKLKTEPSQYVESMMEESLQSDIENILVKMDGVGKASVLITYDVGQEHIFQQDVMTRKSDTEEETESQTVKMSQDGKDEALLVCTKYPICRGVVVVCQGADRAATKLAIIQAISDLTGLNSEHISVIKMKGS